MDQYTENTRIVSIYVSATYKDAYDDPCKDTYKDTRVDTYKDTHKEDTRKSVNARLCHI